MAFIGPVTLVARVWQHLAGVGWTRAAGSLSFATVLGLVPLVTVAFAFVAQVPLFEEFLRVLERFLLRHMLPETATRIVNTYVVGLAEHAATVTGVSIVFVAITAILVVDMVEAEINAIWGIQRKRPLARRILVYVIGLTAGPVLVGGVITLVIWLLQTSIAAVPLEDAAMMNILRPLPFLVTATGFSVLYAVAPARPVAWSHAIISGALAAAAVEVMKIGFAWYIRNVPTYEMLYGTLAAFPVLLLWIFTFWMIVLAGAAVTAALAGAAVARSD